MIKTKSLLLILALIAVKASNAQTSSTIIPKPQQIEVQTGQFVLDKQTSVSFHNTDGKPVKLLIDQIRQVTHFPLATKKQKENSISFLLDKKFLADKPEAYELSVTAQRITVKANSAAGLFNASQSLRQLLPTAIESNAVTQQTQWSIPAVHIKDFPRYSWRGYMQDVSRTFYDVDVIKKYLDIMALYKLNTFHWHLTDDQGWRIEIKKYPKLTSEQATQFHRTESQPAARSGFYTQEQIKDVIAYAKARNITVVPEIDIPGHSWPTILAYPELGVNQNSYPNHIFPFVSSWAYWGTQFTPNTLDPTSERVYEFLDNVFTEIAQLFPAEYIHFGGDEVRHELWAKEAHVKKFMSAHNIPNVHALQSYFVQRVSDIITKKGKKPIGWNDILADAANLPRTTAIMSWLGDKAMKDATSHGFKAVATPASHLYFDITQADRNDGTMSDLGYPQINSLQKVYEYDPSTGLTAEEDKLVLGVQANQWTALTQELKEMNIHNFPRLIALSEIAWSSRENKDYPDFQHRLSSTLPRLDSLRIDYYKPGGYIVAHWDSTSISSTYKQLQLDVSKQVYANGRIQVGFLYLNGKNYLEIDQVELLENGTVIGRDEHHAQADTFRGTNKIKPYFYNFKIDHYKDDATYEIRYTVRGVGGSDSKGNITFNLSPYENFSKTIHFKQQAQ